jgi:tetratricopeptide (TPR) repeat protein
MRVLEAARQGDVEPGMIFGAYVNLGAIHFWKGEIGAAIAQYETALAHSLKVGLRLHAFRARYNLAEAHYSRFRDKGEASDESIGDAYVRDALESPVSDSSPAARESIAALKTTILVAAKPAQPDSLRRGDAATYAHELSEVARQRQILAVPSDPESHAQAHLVIARAYATIAAKEREAALVLVQRAGLQDRFSADFAELQQTFERGLTREQQLANVWKQQASDLLDDARRASLIAHVQRDGAINKSRYAELGAVSPATASKHLAMLTERGLLVQQGKGPSTRYVLPV